MTFQRMTPTTTSGDDDDRDRVDHRRLDLPLQLDGLFDVGRQPLENRVENAARLAGGNHVRDRARRRSSGASSSRRQATRRLRRRRASAESPRRSSCPLPALPRISRHCTSGRPASIITENCRVNTARFFAGAALALRLLRRRHRLGTCAGVIRVTRICSRRSADDDSVHRVAGALAVDRFAAARAARKCKGRHRFVLVTSS